MLAAPEILGVALTPHYEDPAQGIVLEEMVDEIADLGATHISIVTQWSQDDIHSVAIAPDKSDTPDDEVIRRLIRRAHAKKLKVMLFPILWVRNRKMGEWRGTLAPKDEASWWRAYGRFILHYAKIAESEKSEVFSVGSEFASLEAREGRWRKLIAEVRQNYNGQLTYSANWDHYKAVPFWDAVDLIGMTAYHELTDRNDAPQAELTSAWRRIASDLMSWQTEMGRPLVITEVGYPSTDGGARYPWNYTLEGPVDLDEQRMAYEALRDATQGLAPKLGGIFVWNWFGKGGQNDRNYTPKGKPAELLLRAWFREARRGSLDESVDVR